MKRFHSIVALLLAVLLSFCASWFGVAHTHKKSNDTCQAHCHKNAQEKNHDANDQHNDCAACAWQQVSADDATPPSFFQHLATVSPSDAARDYASPISESHSFALEHAPPVGC